MTDFNWTPSPPRHLQRMKPSRGLRPVGEVFAIKFKGVGYFFGRVIRNDCAFEDLETTRPWKRCPGLYLVYVYTPVSRRIDRIPDLRRDDILIPPTMVENDCWTKGYFRPVRKEALTESDIRPAHCFKCEDYTAKGRRIVAYVDEYGNDQKRRMRPFGQAGEPRIVERMIEEALAERA